VRARQDKQATSPSLTFSHGFVFGQDYKVAASRLYILLFKRGRRSKEALKTTKIRRTLCDIVRGKNAVDVQVVNAAMISYIKSKDKNIDKLYRYAENLRVKAKIARYMEVLL